MTTLHLVMPQTLRSSGASHRLTLSCLSRPSGIGIAAVVAGVHLSFTTPLVMAQGNATVAPANLQSATQIAPRITQRVVVKPFDRPESFQSDWRIVGNEIVDMMITGLVNKGVDVMERRTLDDAELESERALIGTVRPDSAAPMGQKLGGQVMLSGGSQNSG